MQNFNGKYTIILNAEYQYIVVFEPQIQTVWTSTKELAELFGVYM